MVWCGLERIKTTTGKKKRGEREKRGEENVLSNDTHVTDVVLEIHNGPQLVGREVRLFSDHNKRWEREREKEKGR